MKKIMIGVVLLAGITILSGCNLKDTLASFSKNKDIGQEAAKAKVEEFIKGSLVPEGTEVNIKDTVKENGLYKIVVAIKAKGQTAEQEITSYLTTDGKKFFPDVMDIEEITKKAQDAKNGNDNNANAQADASGQPAQKEIPKTDAPNVELFVMSYCPYGTQIEKGIIPALEALGSKIKFSLKFVSYTMHGDKEASENVRQYCIQKNSPAKLLGYLKCFLKSSQGSEDEINSCLTSTGLNKSDVDACVSAATAQFNVQKGSTDFAINKDDNTKYGVQGSPTLVINGVTSNTGRDSASLLKAICGAFKTAPKECSTQLSSTAPSPGFGDGTASGSAPAASCATPTN